MLFVDVKRSPSRTANKKESLILYIQSGIKNPATARQFPLCYVLRCYRKRVACGFATVKKHNKPFLALSPLYATRRRRAAATPSFDVR